MQGENLIMYVKFLHSCLQEGLVIPFGTLEKHGRPGKVRGYLQLCSFQEMPNLCPVKTLLAYLSRVSIHSFQMLTNQSLSQAI